MNKQELETAMRVALQEGDYPLLELLSKGAVAFYPHLSFGYAYLAKALVSISPINYNKAEICIAKAAQLAPNNIQYLYQFARLKSTQGQERAAQILWSKILSIEPNNIAALLAKGQYQLQEVHDYTQAIELFNKVIQYRMEHAQSYFYRARAYLGLKQYDKAYKDYSYMLQLHQEQEDIEMLLLKVEILQGLEEHQKLIHSYKAILSIDPDNSYYHIKCAQLLASLECYPEAAQHYDKAMELLHYQDVSVAYQWVDALYANQEYLKALKILDICMELSETPEIGLIKQARIHIQLGQYAAALKKVDWIKKSDQALSLKNELIAIEGEIRLHLKNYEAAIRILTPLLQQPCSYQYEAHYLCGKALFMLGDLDNAYRLIKVASLQNHHRATDFLNQYLQDYLYQLQREHIAANQVFIKQNTQSSFIKNIQGRIWSFKHLQSEKMNSWTTAQLKELTAKMASITLLLTTQGFLLVLPANVALFTYKIAKETSNSIIVQAVALDQLSKVELTLTLSASGLLKYVAANNEDRILVLAESTPSTLEENVKQQLKQHTQPKTIQLLGPLTQNLIDTIW
jgi:tetratricopeptide (TPR) repeat protein